MTASYEMPLYSELISKSWKDVVVYQYHSLTGSPYRHFTVPRRDIIDSAFDSDDRMLVLYLREPRSFSSLSSLESSVIINFECMFKFIVSKNIVIHLVDLEKI